MGLLRRRARKPRPIDPAIERQFGWLRHRGYEVTDSSRYGGIEVMFTSPAVTIRVYYHWKDGEPDVTIARTRAEGDTPYWAMVHLDELARRAGKSERWSKLDADESQRSLEQAYAQGANLLREVASEQVGGTNLEVLDETIAARPRRGVPGLDFPTDDPWYASQEGSWIPTFSLAPRRSVDELLEATLGNDPSGRAGAAIELGPGDDQRGLERLRLLLDDEDGDVRRAAASSLANWEDVESLPRILVLLEHESSDAASPIAAAATFMAIDQPAELRRTVRAALDDFAQRGEPAAQQVKQLRWRLSDHPKRYPKHIKAYIGPEPD